MATIITKISRVNVINSLDTYNHTALQNGMYTVNLDILDMPPSGITITIKQNGTTMATSTAPAAGQQLVSLHTVLNCAINDVIGVQVTSSTTADTGINVFRGLLNIHPGTP